MGLVARLLSFTRTLRNSANVSDVKVNPGGDSNITLDHYSSPGDDAYPLETDYLYAGKILQKGRMAALGYIDPLNTPKSLKGDKRIYARDSSGTLVVEVWLKNTGEATILNTNGSVTLNPDGSIIGQNSNGSFELQQGGDFAVNGVNIAANGDVTIPNSLMLNGKEIADHTHSQANDSGGNTEQDTGPNN